MRYVAAFRTYAWDEDIAELARRFFVATPGSRQVVLADETLGPIDIPGYEKISHTTDTACPGLPNHPPGKSLWYNVDYGIYYLQRELPEFDYYLLSESDLAVNVSLEEMVRFAFDRRIDMIAHGVEPSTPDWFWHHHGLVLSEKPWRSLLFFMMLSRRAIHYLLEERMRLAVHFDSGDLGLWPFCEAFVPTALKSKGMRVAKVSAFVTTEDLNFRPWLSLHDSRANRPGSLAHSVLGGKRFIATLLANNPARDYFREGSQLREGLLQQAPLENIVSPLCRALARNHDHAGVAMVEDEAIARGWTLDSPTDLAFCKPAVSSSLSRHSRFQDPEADASGANGDPICGDYGFHTSKEANPWWMVDLLGECWMEEVAIVNRRNYPDRFKVFYIEISREGAVWTTVCDQTDPVDVSSDVESPWRFKCGEPILCRYLRIVLLGIGPLHLRRIQVFGRADRSNSNHLAADSGTLWPHGPLADLALHKPAVSSSASRWSRHQDSERDAIGANSDLLAHDYAFHTQFEREPWWMVDLLRESAIEEVAIVNRRSEPQRFDSFRIQSSLDGSIWTTQYEKADASPVSSDAASPWRMRFSTPFPARYVRVVLSGEGILHLRRVQVFGRNLPFRQQPPLL
jgi:hypothetical protein